MKTHDQLIKKLMARPSVKIEVGRIEREEAMLLDALLKARQEAGLSQAQIADRMGTQAPAIARLERSLATGKHSPSIATVRKYVTACGKKLLLQVAWRQLNLGVCSDPLVQRSRQNVTNIKSISYPKSHAAQISEVLEINGNLFFITQNGGSSGLVLEMSNFRQAWWEKLTSCSA